MASLIMQYFKYNHLPKHLQSISKPFGELANLVDQSCFGGDQTEKQEALRKLLEAKDCAVRSYLTAPIEKEK